MWFKALAVHYRRNRTGAVGSVVERPILPGRLWAIFGVIRDKCTPPTLPGETPPLSKSRTLPGFLCPCPTGHSGQMRSLCKHSLLIMKEVLIFGVAAGGVLNGD
jgi:hypothetical protein